MRKIVRLKPHGAFRRVGDRFTTVHMMTITAPVRDSFGQGLLWSSLALSCVYAVRRGGFRNRSLQVAHSWRTFFGSAGSQLLPFLDRTKVKVRSPGVASVTGTAVSLASP